MAFDKPVAKTLTASLFICFVSFYLRTLCNSSVMCCSDYFCYFLCGTKVSN